MKKTCALSVTIVLQLLVLCGSVGWAEKLATGTAAVQEKPAVSPAPESDGNKGTETPQEQGGPGAPEYYLDVLQPQDTKQAASGSPASPRFFLDIFYGSVSTEDSSVSASYEGGCFIFCSPSVAAASRNVHFDRSGVFGVRYGSWLRRTPAIGLALDVSYLQARAPGVTIWYVPISFVLMARYPFLRSDSVPDGRLQLYGGLMLSEVIGDIEVDFRPQMPYSVGGASVDFNLGGGVLFGLAWHFPSYALFGEVRMLRTSLEYDSGSDDSWLSWAGKESAKSDLDTTQMMFGLSFKF